VHGHPPVQAVAAGATSLSLAIPVVTEMARRAMVGTTAAGANGYTAAVQCLTHMMHTQVLGFWSLLISLVLSAAATCTAALRFLWENWLESIVIIRTPAREERFLHGVDVTQSDYLARPAVMEVLAFAESAHQGQLRRTGDPYIRHCVETAFITEQLMILDKKVEDARVELAVKVALLHDVVDDTRVSLEEVDDCFGPDICRLVGDVTKLSQINQLVRRKQRQAIEKGLQEAYKSAEQDELRDLILTMCNEPMAILIKLADRLHNMRTVWALQPNKAQAVASETARIWCALAERLGMFPIKMELEDLCFAVLQPEQYSKLRHDLLVFWGCIPSEEQAAADRAAKAAAPPPPLPSKRMSFMERLQCLDDPDVEAATDAILRSHRPDVPLESSQEEAAVSGNSLGASPAVDESPELLRLTPEQAKMREVVTAVEPFWHLSYKDRIGSSGVGEWGTRRAGLRVIEECGSELRKELPLCGYATGMEVRTEGRLKSIYSMHRKMVRKGVPLEQVYDTRALRVVIDGQGVCDTSECISALYSIRTAVQRMWKPILGESDDYVANPKGSGRYQSLHLAVMGPGNVPMEVQLRTRDMHEDAEYGAAAHWVYKETSPNTAQPADPGVVEVGQPVLRVEDLGNLADGIVLEVNRGGLELLVATLRRGRLTRGTSARASNEHYRYLYDYVQYKRWTFAGQADTIAGLQTFVLCKDGKYHFQDAYGHNHSTIIVPLLGDLPLEEPKEFELAPPPKWPSAAATTAKHEDGAATATKSTTAVEAGQKRSPAANTKRTESPAETAASAKQRATDIALAEKTGMLRAMLEWGKDIDPDDSHVTRTDEVLVIVAPGDIHRLPRGSTAGQLVREKGLSAFQGRPLEGNTLNVNNTLVTLDHVLSDGDLIKLPDMDI